MAAIRDEAWKPSLVGPVRVELTALTAEPPEMLLPPGYYADADEREGGCAWPSESHSPYPAKAAPWEWERIVADLRRAEDEFRRAGAPGLYAGGMVRVTICC